MNHSRKIKGSGKAPKKFKSSTENEYLYIGILFQYKLTVRSSFIVAGSSSSLRIQIVLVTAIQKYT